MKKRYFQTERIPDSFPFLFKLIKDKELQTTLFKMPPFGMFPADVYGEKMLALSWQDTEETFLEGSS